VPLSEESDRLIEKGLGHYVVRAEPKFVRYEKPIPDGVQYERYPVHEVAMIQELWRLVGDMRKQIKTLERKRQ
jgi:hypothetical protein